jgi:hypothetical protein
MLGTRGLKRIFNAAEVSLPIAVNDQDLANGDPYLGSADGR